MRPVGDHPLNAGVGAIQSHLLRILTEEFGEQPGLLLDTLGRIVAANDAAALLLARPMETLAGAPFGVWAPLLDQMDLDVVQTVGEKTRAIVVRARRIIPSVDDPYVPVLLCEMPEADATMMTESVSLAIVQANKVLQGAFRRFSVGRLPPVKVSSEVQNATVELILFLVQMAGSLDPELEVSLVNKGENWVEVAFRLEMGGDSNVLRWEENLKKLDLPFLGVDGEACRLTFDYPNLCAVVRMPAAGAGVQSGLRLVTPPLK